MDTEIEHCKPIIFTTIDSSLLRQDYKSYQFVLATIKKLQNAKIILFAIAQKTDREIAHLL